MERNMDLCREILLYVERQPLGGRSLDFGQFPYNKPDQVFYNAKLLADAGFIDAKAMASNLQVNGMTWSGHEFLDAARDDTVWNKGKAAVVKAGGGLAFEVLKAVLVGLCTQAAKSAAGIP